MKPTLVVFSVALAILTACSGNEASETATNMEETTKDSLTFKSAYAAVNGLSMYFEINGNDRQF